MAQQDVAAQVAIYIDENLLLGSVRKKLEEDDDRDSGKFKQCTIYKAHELIRSENPRAYEPQIISIGPYHRDREHLRPMERLKRQFLRDLLDRHQSNELDKYIKAISTASFVAEARNCYSEQVISGNEFVEIMLLDGCFIVEFLVRTFCGDRDGELDSGNWNRSIVEMDLLLLENQIPFSVLQAIFDASVIPGLQCLSPPITLLELALCCIRRDRYDGIKKTPSSAHHLLHLCHSSLYPGPRPKNTLSGSWSVMQVITESFIWVTSLLLECRRPILSEDIPRVIPRATELDDAGVKFVVKKEASSLLDITFRDGILEIPRLSINTATVSMLKNLVAFEQSCIVVSATYVTSYVTLMDYLIDMPEDVALLERSGILESNLGGNQEVANFINSLGKGVYLDYENHRFMELFKQVTKYSGTEARRWMTKVVRQFAFLACVILFLTVAQTFFAVFAYFRPPTSA